jgi:murein DD-endopeptidase MepM/ murein hydrolase activator NlpD
MSVKRRAASALLVGAGLAAGSAVPAHAVNAGGTGAPTGEAPVTASKAPSAKLSGGSAYSVGRLPSPGRPTVGLLRAPSSALAGRPPRVVLRVDDPGAALVSVRVTVTALSTRRPVLIVSLGWVRSGRTLAVHWPRGARLGPGSYHVSLTAQDARGGTLLRRAHSSGVATLVILAPVLPSAPPSGSAAAPTPAGVPTPAQLAAAGAVFPVAGAHNFGGPENRFGAPRGGHTHQGQDVLTSEGTRVVAPLAGTVITVGYEASGAGYYAAEHTSVGFDFFFAHCMSGSLALATGESIGAGQLLCRAGQTGDATAPHLHFEMWVGGWHSPGGYPTDPLPYLEALDHTAAAA